MKIAGFGIACLDCIASVGEMDSNNSAPINRMDRRMGGLVGNALLTCSRLGAETELVTALGTDETGDTIMQLLRREGIGTGLVRRYEGCESYFSFIRIDERTAERYIFCKRDTVNPGDIALDNRLLEGASVLLVDSHFMPKSIEYAAMAAELGIPVVGDYKLSPANAELLRYTNYPIISRDYALWLSSDGTLESALAAMAEYRPGAVPVITCGDRGCLYMEDGTVRYVQAFDIVPADTAAAGDVFHGGFAWALAEGCSVRAALVFASACSAIKCTRFGGSAGAPELWEVRDFLRKRNM